MKRRTYQLAIALLAALLLHIAGIILISLYPQEYPTPVENKQEAIKIQLKPKKQLVQVKPTQKNQQPRKSDYLNEFNNRVEKETRARNLSSRPNQQAQKIPPGPPLKRGGIKPSKPIPKLLPSWQELESLAPQTSFNDHLDNNLEESAETRLNTFEWKYATYFNRIKESVSRTWSPNTQIKRYDPAGALLNKSGHLTVVEVQINSDGEVTHIAITKPSGIFYLDDEAIAAFERAELFPNPPTSLFANQNFYNFSFGFHVSMKRGFSVLF